ncbi:MAG TPA: phosphoribosylformimino-5-aminoimidazole carboxamide ribotide isomerase [Lachnospiraceae bacterium]|nr:phosphoribosylformimino-5-aminoimidazole carboxamide ribotide isomerase [Lachnospiraceae bacterium]
MHFRPCIDIHNGKVKQIVGSSLSDEGDRADENYVSAKSAADFARIFKKDGQSGGHVILLNPKTSPYYEATKQEAMGALAAYPGGLMAGGGITAENADVFLNAGASHVIVTSFVFFNGEISLVNLGKLETAVGKEHLVLDLSCSRKDGAYYIMTDRWQKYTRTPLTKSLLDKLAGHCSGFLVHGIDVEGKNSGIDRDLVSLLTAVKGFPVTYAGGIRNFEDLSELRTLGHGCIDVTIGSALSLYGGDMSYEAVVGACKEN